MSQKNKPTPSGIVFSTNPNFNYGDDTDDVIETLPPEKQNLKIFRDSKQRKGKTVTLVTGFDMGFGLDVGMQFGFFQTKIGYNFGIWNISNVEGIYVYNNGFSLTATFLFGAN